MTIQVASDPSFRQQVAGHVAPAARRVVARRVLGDREGRWPVGILHDASKKIGEVLGRVRSSSDKMAVHALGIQSAPTIDVQSDQFGSGGALPSDATVEGSGGPPDLHWSPPPAGTQSVAVICEDPDAPMPEPFVHWLVYDLPPTTTSLPVAGVREGLNSTMNRGFTPAAPPPGHGTHHYHFQVFAMDAPIELPEGAGKSSLLDAMRGHVLAWGDLVGTYQRN